MSDVTTTTEFEATVTLKIAQEQIRSLLCSAFEGGSNYWYRIERYEYPPETTEDDFQCDHDWPQHCYNLPFVDGGAVIIQSMDDDRVAEDFRLDAAAIRRGVQRMAEDCPRHFADVMSENADATTGDVFLQCCLFGEIIYG